MYVYDRIANSRLGEHEDVRVELREEGEGSQQFIMSQSSSSKAAIFDQPQFWGFPGSVWRIATQAHQNRQLGEALKLQ